MKRILLLSQMLFALSITYGQELSKADYNRAVGFMWDNVNNKKAFNLTTNPNWLSDSTGFWFVHFASNERRYDLVTLKPLLRRPLFDHSKLAEKLSEALKEVVNSKSMTLENLSSTKGVLKFSMKGKHFQWDDRQGVLRTVDEVKPNDLEVRSPDGKWIAYSDHYNLYIKSTEKGTIRQLSKAGKKDYEYASYYGWSDIMEGENGERPKRFAAEWSPDSRFIQTSICDLRFARKMYLLDWSVDTLYRARLLSYYRGSPGDTSVVHLIPVVFDIETGTEHKLPLPRIAHETGYSFDWMKQPGMGLIDYRQRGFQKASVIKMDILKSSHQVLFSDSSHTNIDGFSSYLGDAKERLFVTSERSGWKHVYSVDVQTGAFRQLTSGSFFVNYILHADEKSGLVYFLASGREPGRNPYQQYLYSVTLDGKTLKLLTPETGNHEISLSPDKRFVTDSYSTPDQPAVTVLRELKSGKVLMELERADISGLLAMKWSAPQSFTAIGKDGKSTIYGLLWKPVNFDPNRKYPIIDNSYTGPHGQIVPRTFSRVISSNNQSMAELGFIVMMVDGLGTAGRSKEFHNYSYKRMGYNLEDHVRAIRQLSRQYAWIDTTRVGIFGHSAGGYDAGHAMLQYPDFYKVAVASSADHDFRMEKAWWPEMYMGWPVDSTYHQQSNITMASRLKGKLLITHGGIDENVNPSATFKLAEMLERADKQFDMLIFPSQRHGYTGAHQLYFTKKRWNYFVEHLLGQKPLWEFEWK